MAWRAIAVLGIRVRSAESLAGGSRIDTGIGSGALIRAGGVQYKTRNIARCRTMETAKNRK
jgi:hypothetical protein